MTTTLTTLIEVCIRKSGGAKASPCVPHFIISYQTAPLWTNRPQNLQNYISTHAVWEAFRSELRFTPVVVCGQFQPMCSWKGCINLYYSESTWCKLLQLGRWQRVFELSKAQWFVLTFQSVSQLYTINWFAECAGIATCCMVCWNVVATSNKYAE